jgi:hypothetical protein
VADDQRRSAVVKGEGRPGRSEPIRLLGTFLKIAATLAGVATLLLQLGRWLPLHARRPVTSKLDLSVYYAAALRLARGQPLYDGLFLYPPPFAAAMRPAAALTPQAFQAIWYASMLVSFWLYAWGVARLAFGRPASSWRHLFGVGFLAFMVPGMDITLSYGNADLMVWALIAWALAEDNAIALLVATAMKLYPAPGLAVVCWRKRQLGRAAVVAVALALVTVVVVGIGPIADWLRMGGAPLPRFVFIPDNVSLSIAVLRLCRCYDLGSPLARALLRGIPLAAIALALWVTRRRSTQVQASAAITIAMWAAPVCWWPRLPFLLVPLAVWWRERTAPDRSGEPRLDV